MPVRTQSTTCSALITLWAYLNLRFCYLGYTKALQAVKQAEDQNLPVKISIRFAPFQVMATSSVSTLTLPMLNLHHSSTQL